MFGKKRKNNGDDVVKKPRRRRLLITLIITITLLIAGYITISSSWFIRFLLTQTDSPISAEEIVWSPLTGEMQWRNAQWHFPDDSGSLKVRDLKARWLWWKCLSKEVAFEHVRWNGVVLEANAASGEPATPSEGNGGASAPAEVANVEQAMDDIFGGVLNEKERHFEDVPEAQEENSWHLSFSDVELKDMTFSVILRSDSSGDTIFNGQISKFVTAHLAGAEEFSFDLTMTARLSAPEIEISYGSWEQTSSGKLNEIWLPSTLKTTLLLCDVSGSSRDFNFKNEDLKFDFSLLNLYSAKPTVEYFRFEQRLPERLSTSDDSNAGSLEINGNYDIITNVLSGAWKLDLSEYSCRLLMALLVISPEHDFGQLSMDGGGEFQLSNTELRSVGELNLNSAGKWRWGDFQQDNWDADTKIKVDLSYLFAEQKLCFRQFNFEVSTAAGQHLTIYNPEPLLAEVDGDDALAIRQGKIVAMLESFPSEMLPDFVRKFLPFEVRKGELSALVECTPPLDPQLRGGVMTGTIQLANINCTGEFLQEVSGDLKVSFDGDWQNSNYRISKLHGSFGKPDLEFMVWNGKLNYNIIDRSGAAEIDDLEIDSEDLMLLFIQHPERRELWRNLLEAGNWKKLLMKGHINFSENGEQWDCAVKMSLEGRSGLTLAVDGNSDSWTINATTHDLPLRQFAALFVPSEQHIVTDAWNGTIDGDFSMQIPLDSGACKGRWQFDVRNFEGWVNWPETWRNFRFSGGSYCYDETTQLLTFDELKLVSLSRESAGFQIPHLGFALSPEFKPLNEEVDISVSGISLREWLGQEWPNGEMAGTIKTFFHNWPNWEGVVELSVVLDLVQRKSNEVIPKKVAFAGKINGLLFEELKFDNLDWSLGAPDGEAELLVKVNGMWQPPVGGSDLHLLWSSPDWRWWGVITGGTRWSGAAEGELNFKTTNNYHDSSWNGRAVWTNWQSEHWSGPLDLEFTFDGMRTEMLTTLKHADLVLQRSGAEKLAVGTAQASWSNQRPASEQANFAIDLKYCDLGRIRETMKKVKIEELDIKDPQRVLETESVANTEEANPEEPPVEQAREPWSWQFSSVGFVGEFKAEQIRISDTYSGNLLLQISGNDRTFNLDSLAIKVNDGNLNASGNAVSQPDGNPATYELEVTANMMDIGAFWDGWQGEGSDEQHLSGMIETMDLKAAGKGWRGLRFWDDLEGSITMEASNIDIPNSVQETVLGKLLLLPLEAYLKVRSLVPDLTQLPRADLNRAVSFITDFYENTRNFHFDQGGAKLVSTDGVITIERFELLGNPIRNWDFSGQIAIGTKQFLNLNSLICFGDLRIPVPIEGTLKNPNINWTLFTRDLLVRNIIGIPKDVLVDILTLGGTTDFIIDR